MLEGRVKEGERERRGGRKVAVVSCGAVINLLLRHSVTASSKAPIHPFPPLLLIGIEGIWEVSDLDSD